MNKIQTIIRKKIKFILFKNNLYFLLLSLVLFCVLYPSQLLAGGALPYCLGAKMCQMGGAGVATPLDATSGNVNPALMAMDSNELDLQPLAVFKMLRSIHLARALPKARLFHLRADL